MLRFTCGENQNLAKYQKVSKFYVHDCLQNLLLRFMFFLAALILKSLILAGILVYLSKNGPGPNLKAFRYQV